MSARRLVQIPIYDVALWVVLDENPKAVRKEPFFVEIFGKHKTGRFTGLADLDHDGTFGVFLPLNPSPGLLAHEGLHLTNLILDHVGSTFDATNDEHAAYLIKFIVDEIQATIMTEI